VTRQLNPKGTVKIGIVGKYTSVVDSYKSLAEALTHAGIANNVAVEMVWLSAEALESGNTESLDAVQAILVPGGFGERGTAGKIRAVQYARENNIPYFGICFGMQMAVIEIARHLAGLPTANSTELGQTSEPVVGLMTEWENQGTLEKRSLSTNKGGTMRLGAYECVLRAGSKARAIYGADSISERHRHRYEVNINYQTRLENVGLQFSGLSPDGGLPEIVELTGHPWFIGVQFHPELKSKPHAPHPLFVSFVAAALGRL
jgi:CTP synthase